MTNNWKLIKNGPQNVDELICEILARCTGFFLYKGAEKFRPIYDLLMLNLSEYTEKAYQICKTDKDIVDYYIKQNKSLGLTLRLTLKDNGRCFYLIDRILCKIPDFSNDKLFFIDFIGEEMYKKINTLTNDKEVSDWSAVRYSPFLDAICSLPVCQHGVNEL